MSLTTQKLPIIVGIDANAQVGQYPGDSIGEHAADRETPNGELLRAFCETHALCAPATFLGPEGCCRRVDAQSYTWVSPAGERYRIDYVLLPRSLLPAVQSCDVLHDFDDGGFDDHFPAAVTVGFGGLPDGDSTVEYSRIRHRTVADVHSANLDVKGACCHLEGRSWAANVREHVASLDQAMWRACKPTASETRPAKPYITPDCWYYIRLRKVLLQQVRGHASQQDRSLLLLGMRSLGAATGVRPANHRRLLRLACTYAAAGQAKAQALAERGRLRSLLVACLRQAKAAHIEQMAQKYAQAVSKSDVRALFASLRFFRPAGRGVFKGFGPLAVLQNEEGEPAATYEQQQAVHRRRFEAQEAGHIISRDNYAGLPLLRPPNARYQLRDLPTLAAVEAGIRQAQDGKAPGPSGVPICMWKSCPTDAAAALLPIFVKSHVRLTEPVQYRGAKLAALFKKAGLAVQASSFRSIALMDPTAKLHHKLMRPELLSSIETGRAPLQQGCLPNSSPTALTHFLLTKLRLAALQGTSAAIIFLDLTAAYYRLIREAIFAPDVGDAHLCWLLQKLRVDPAQVQEVAGFVRQGALLPTASPHFKRALAMMFRHTFFVMDGVRELTATSVGSRPGDAISDTLFALAVTSLREQLQCSGLPAVQVPAWADDLALPVTGPADQIEAIVEVAGRTLHQACLRRAMSPNYGDGKTEVLLSLAGTHARKVGHRLFRTGQGCVPLQTVPPVDLKCVFQYKHLGTLLTAKGRPIKDLRIKLGAACGAANPLAKHVLRRGDVAQGSRVHLLDTLAVSRAKYGVAVWGRLDKQCQQAWAAGVGALYRYTVRPTITEHGPVFPDLAELCRTVRRPLPQDTWRILLLEHLRMLGALGQTAVVDALLEEAEATPHSWLAAAEEAVAWLDALSAGCAKYQA